MIKKKDEINMDFRTWNWLYSEREREYLIGLNTGAVPFYIYSEPPYRKDVGLKIDFGSVIGAVK